MPYKDNRQIKENTRKRKAYAENRKEAIEILGGHCIQCNTTKNLEFDHIEPSKKNINIGEALRNSKKKWMAELAKCQLLCSTCHKKKSNEENKRLTHGTEYAYRKYLCRCAECIAGYEVVKQKTRERTARYKERKCST